MSLQLMKPGNNNVLKKYAFHPILFALYPILTLLAQNVSQVLFVDSIRVFVFVLLLAVMLTALFRVFISDWHKVALLVSGTEILFFSYGHVISSLRGEAHLLAFLGRTSLVLSIWGTLFAILILWIVRHSNPDKLSLVFNIIGLALVVLPVFKISNYYIQSAIIRNSQTRNRQPGTVAKAPEMSPDIYYIILDMHARADVLQSVYGYDNTWFLDALKENGFYVADQSTSNYSSTLQSISSSLNMDYINDLQDVYGSESANREPYGKLIAENQVFNVFIEKGYTIGAFKSGDFYTEFRDLEYYIKPSKEEIRQYQNMWSLNPFEGIFLQTTLLRVLYDLGIVSSKSAQQNTLETPYDLHRLTILTTMERLPDFAKKDGTFFVFAHVVSPHPPYVFDRKGREIRHAVPFSLAGPGRQNGDNRNVQMYVDQLHYIDMLTLKAVQEILAKSDPAPIIIIQSDHGPVSYNGEDEVTISNMKEQHAILNAYYFPDRNYHLLYPEITPVNSFRVVLNTYFGATYDLLPDRNYFIPHARPFDFIDVTDRVRMDELTP